MVGQQKKQEGRRLWKGWINTVGGKTGRTRGRPNVAKKVRIDNGEANNCDNIWEDGNEILQWENMLTLSP